MEEKIVYFEQGGETYTDEALRIAKEYADANNINSIIVASTRGQTAQKAAKVFEGKNIVVVTHVHGFRESNRIEFSPEIRKEIETKGIKVITTAHVMGGMNRLVEGSVGSIVANTLRMLSQGVKVAVEIAAEAADAGHVQTDEDVISIAGTSRGADTVIVLRPANSRKFFEMKIKKILAMPI